MIEEIALKMSDNRDGGDGDEGEGRTGIVTKTRPKTKKPSLYKVLLLNDDYTPMEFVVHVLEKYFNKGREDATRIMLIRRIVHTARLSKAGSIRWCG